MSRECGKLYMHTYSYLIIRHVRISGNIDKTGTWFSEKSFVGKFFRLFHSRERTMWDEYVCAHGKVKKSLEREN